VKTRLILGCALVAALLIPLSATAQTQRTAITFVMPQSVDPERLTITVDGFTYTNEDGASPGDNEGNSIVGNMFLPFDGGGLGGLEVHGAIPNPSDGTFEVKEVVLRTSYMGGIIDVFSETAPEFDGFTPWTFVDASTPNERIYRFLKGANSGTLDQGDFFALIKATTDDPNFPDAPFTVTGYTQIQGVVPEPGSVALLLSGVTGAMLLRLRRRK
jgi:hypothetical protein